MPYLTIHGRLGRASLFGGIPLGIAIWYTIKIFRMDDQELLRSALDPVLALSDIPFLVLFAFIGFPLMQSLVQLLLCVRILPHKSLGRKWFPVLAGTMFLYDLIFLLAFYPAPGMNDTVFMMDNPKYAGVQFPWLYSLIYGYEAEAARKLFGTREVSIFILSCLQLAVISAVLTRFSFWVKEHVDENAGYILYLYFLLFPMSGNYAIAAVRDGLFSAALLVWMWLFITKRKEKWERGRYILLTAAALGLMLLRSNGAAAAVLMAAFLMYHNPSWKKILAVILCCLVISIVPGRMILHEMNEEPLFQESMGIPLQQMGRVLALDGSRSESTVLLMDHLLPEENWKNDYQPYTVDYVKWNDDFRRGWLNDHKKEFLLAWADTGLKNPRLYLEGWMTQTYGLWSLIPGAYDVQSRFGWALTDENTKHMLPADNDRMAVGNFPMPSRLKSFLANFQYEGSQFLGAGFAFWLTILLSAAFYADRRSWCILAALPLLLNTATLLAATPAGYAFRYSFAYVWGLPVLLILLFLRPEKEEL